MRAEIDESLMVGRWQLPGGSTLRDRGRVEEESAPEWWLGAEEASQSFLTAMGVRLE